MADKLSSLLVREFDLQTQVAKLEREIAEVRAELAKESRRLGFKPAAAEG